MDALSTMQSLFGKPSRVEKPTEDRYESFVTRQPSGCWTWTGPSTVKSMSFQRYTYILFNGSAKRYVFSRCKTIKCVNPNHLTTSDTLKSKARRARMYCPINHKMSVANTIYDRLGNPMCKRCKEIADNA